MGNDSQLLLNVVSLLATVCAAERQDSCQACCGPRAGGGLMDPGAGGEDSGAVGKAREQLQAFLAKNSGTFRLFVPSGVAGWAQLSPRTKCLLSWPHVVLSDGKCASMPDMGKRRQPDALAVCSAGGGHLAAPKTRADVAAIFGAFAGLNPPNAVMNGGAPSRAQTMPAFMWLAAMQSADQLKLGKARAKLGWYWADGSGAIPPGSPLWIGSQPDGFGSLGVGVPAGCATIFLDGRGLDDNACNYAGVYTLCGY